MKNFEATFSSSVGEKNGGVEKRMNNLSDIIRVEEKRVY